MILLIIGSTLGAVGDFLNDNIVFIASAILALQLIKGIIITVRANRKIYTILCLLTEYLRYIPYVGTVIVLIQGMKEDLGLFVVLLGVPVLLIITVVYAFVEIASITSIYLDEDGASIGTVFFLLFANAAIGTLLICIFHEPLFELLATLLAKI